MVRSIMVGTVEEQESDAVWERHNRRRERGKPSHRDWLDWTGSTYQLRIMDLTLSLRPFKVMLCAMSSSISSWSVIYMGVS